MAVATLSFIASEQEIISGVPQTLTIESNVPATIYYTLDGTDPTIASSIYIDAISMPENESSVIVSAFAANNDGEGPILTQTFATNATHLNRTRNVDPEGIVVTRSWRDSTIVDRYDADNQPTYIEMEIEDLEIVKKEKGFNGIEEGTVIQVNVPAPSETASFIDDNFVQFSTPEVGELFNPEARTIVIDNRKDNDINITLRTYCILHNEYTEYGGRRIRETTDDANYVSGGYVRRFYSGKNNVMVSYYFDHNEGRYVKNIQTLPNGITDTFSTNKYGQPLVFQWLPRGKPSSI